LAQLASDYGHGGVLACGNAWPDVAVVGAFGFTTWVDRLLIFDLLRNRLDESACDGNDTYVESLLRILITITANGLGLARVAKRCWAAHAVRHAASVLLTYGSGVSAWNLGAEQHCFEKAKSMALLVVSLAQ
jgi:hypothetical protein